MSSARTTLPPLEAHNLHNAHALAGRLRIPKPDDLLHANRLRYYGRTQRHGPPELIALAEHGDV
eukprot:6551599-Lingulodinium_polyedra.AAC.1